MRVLLTRAAEEAARTRTILEGLGHRVLVSPVIAIEATGVAWPGGVVDAVLATSAQAFLAVADDWGPPLEARRLVPLWLVGQRTETVARARGFAGAAYVTSDVGALVSEMGQRGGLGRVVYLAGRDRKRDVETALSVVETLEVYKAVALDQLEDEAVRALAENSLDAVLHYSRRSAALFADLVRGASVTTNALQICLSEDVASPLIGGEWMVRVAAEPTEASLISALAAP